MKHYDVALVLGKGIYEDGSIPDSAKAMVKKAVELYKAKQVDRVIFSGKWSYFLKYSPPITEAEAMAVYAKVLGLPDGGIELETASVTTISNLCNIKTKLLEPNDWKKIVLISIDPLQERSLTYMKIVLGCRYAYDVILADFSFPKDKYEMLKKSEQEKMIKEVEFIDKIKEGNCEMILKLEKEELLRRGYKS